jgi:hypothetical protein
MQLPRIVESDALVIESLSRRSTEEKNDYRRNQKSFENANCHLYVSFLMLIRA